MTLDGQCACLLCDMLRSSWHRDESVTVNPCCGVELASEWSSPIVWVLAYVVARRACRVHGEVKAALFRDMLEDGLAHRGATYVPQTHYEDRRSHTVSKTRRSSTEEG